MSDSREITVMRAMAWERAKGELQSILASVFDDEEFYTEAKKAVEEFIKKMEDEVGI